MEDLLIAENFPQKVLNTCLLFRFQHHCLFFFEYRYRNSLNLRHVFMPFFLFFFDNFFRFYGIIHKSWFFYLLQVGGRGDLGC